MSVARQARSVAAIAAVTALTAAAQSPPIASRTITEDLDRIVRAAAPKGFFGAVLVARDGRVLLDRGYGTKVARQPIDTDTLFDIASVGKHFTAATVLALVDKKRLRLDDTLGDRIRRVPSDKSSITVRQLLDHTAGLTRDINWAEDEVQSRAAMLERALIEPLESRPGEMFGYSNVGYQILAALIEIVGGRPFEEVVHRTTLQPAGLDATGFVRDPRLDPARAAPRWEGTRDPRYADSAVDWAWHWAFRGAAGVVTSARELYRWDRALTADDGALTAAVRDPIATVEPTVRYEYAFGLERSRTPRFTTRLSHTGRCYGFRSLFVRFPDEDACIVVLGNAQTKVGVLDLDLEKRIFAESAPGSALEAAVGTFALADSDDRFVLRREADALIVEPRGPEACARLLYGEGRAPTDRMNRRSFEGHALDLCEPLLSRRVAVDALAEAFGESAASNAAQDVARAWRELTESHGRCHALEWIGSDPESRTSWLDASFGRAAQHRERLVLRWDTSGRRLSKIDLGAALPQPPRVTMRWLHGTRFAARALRAPASVRLHVAKTRTGTHLVWTDLQGDTPCDRLD